MLSAGDVIDGAKIERLRTAHLSTLNGRFLYADVSKGDKTNTIRFPQGGMTADNAEKVRAAIQRWASQ